METSLSISKDILIRAYRLMFTAKEMSVVYEENKQITAKYVHATSRGHEALQLAAAFQLKPQDYVYPYYRDDAMLLGMGFSPYELMLQLMAKGNDPFSGGRTYYCHPSYRSDDKPKIPHQSSATGMQAIPATGAAQAIQYLERMKIRPYTAGDNPICLCSLGDGSITEGEVSEAFQMAVLHQYPIIYLIQDNEWDISATASEIRAQDAPYFARGFKGMRVKSLNGSDFFECHEALKEVVETVRRDRQPYMVHAKVPLLNHHTSGVRKEWYRNDLDIDAKADPLPVLKNLLYEAGLDDQEISRMEEEARQHVFSEYEKTLQQKDPEAEELTQHIFAPTPITEEKGEREPANGQTVVMVDAALHAVDEILKAHPESLLYGQDVGGELGGVFREAATLAKKYGDERVFNTPIMEAYIIGSTCGMSAVGCKPIVEVQFADYVWPGLNQLFTELSRSYYLSNGKWNSQALIRVPIGAYGSGGPYHSSSVESVLLQIKGVKVCYPSNAADMKGLLKAAFYDPNPVVIFEHKGLYWSKVPGTKEAMCIEPDEDYVVPLGKARIAQQASSDCIENGESLLVITYGMGVYWAKNASQSFPDQVEILDLRSLNPLDEESIAESVRRHGKVLVLTEETINNSFAEALAGRISQQHFQWLDGPVRILGSVNTPAVPLNAQLEQAMLPNADKVESLMREMLSN